MYDVASCLYCSYFCLGEDSVCVFLASVEGLTDSAVTGGEDQQEADTKNETPQQTKPGFTVLGGFENKPVQKVQWPSVLYVTY